MTARNQRLAGMLLLLAACRAASSDPGRPGAQAQALFSHTLPALDGGRLGQTIVEVSYGPGGASPPHSHPCPVIGYVLQGALRSRVDGDSEVVYRAGQTFYEAPGGVHRVSANASTRDPVRFLAIFTCDRDTALSVALPDTSAPLNQP